MKANFGIMPPLDQPLRSKRDRGASYARRAEHSMHDYLAGICFA
jgi:folate-dependent tRNA-U54 methylase TrmFO/GidA